MNKKLGVIALSALVLCMSATTFAQTQPTTTSQPMTTTLKPKSKAATAPVPVETGELKSEKQHVYDRPTIAKLSQLYWALGKFEFDNDEDVDNFMKINECDIYKDYHHNEFEWSKIRESGRDFLKENKKKFGLRIEYVQPLRLGEYDFKTKQFAVHGRYAIDGSRMFEVLAKDMDEGVCRSGVYDIPGYPRALSIELSRPFTLKNVPVREDIAKRYVQDKAEQFKALKEEAQTEEMLYNTRDAYLVMQVKIFSFKGETLMRENYHLGKVLGVLESYEIYADPDLNQLIYSENLLRRKDRSEAEIEMKRKYQERLKKEMEERKNREKLEANMEAGRPLRPEDIPKIEHRTSKNGPITPVTP